MIIGYLILLIPICGTLAQVQTIGNMNYQDLPDQVKNYIENVLELNGPEDNKYNQICCSIGFETVVTYETKLVQLLVTVSYDEMFIEPCHHKNCTKYRTSYRNEMTYVVESYPVTMLAPCPVTYHTCCAGYFKIAGYCIPLSWVTQNQALVLSIIQSLNSSG